MAYNASQHQAYADRLRDWMRQLAQLKAEADTLRDYRQYVINDGVAGTMNPPSPGSGDFWGDTDDYTTDELETASLVQNHFIQFIEGGDPPSTTRNDEIAIFAQVN